MNNEIKNERPNETLYFFAVILKYKWFIIIMTIISAITSVVVAFLLPVWFASTISFVPPTESGSTISSSTSGLSSMMKDFGLSKIGGSAKEEYTMLVFLQSRSVMDSIIRKYDLAKVYDIPDSLPSEVRKEFAANVDIAYLDEGNYELTVWDTDKQRACDIANDYVRITNQVAEKTHQEELNVNVRYFTERINSINETIVTITNELSILSKSKGIFSPEEQAKAAGEALSNLKSTAMEFGIMYDYSKMVAGDDDPQTITYKGLYETAQKKAEEALTKPGFVGNFALNNAAAPAVQYLTKYADIEALTKVKALLTTSLEKAQLEARDARHNFFVVDKAIPADKKDKPKRIFIVAGGTLGGTLLSVFILLLVNGVKVSIKKAKKINQLQNEK